MNPRLTGLVCLLVVGVAGGIVAGRLLDRAAAGGQGPRTPVEPSAALLDLQTSFRAASRHVIPSVVHITNTTRRWRRTVQTGTGSGVIVAADGTIVTNAHVIAQAGLGDAQIVVRTYDGREFPARVVGTDTPSDIAVIRVEDGGDFTPATLGDSDAVQVGDLVLAVGSPFELNHSVTQGIISAVSRQLDDPRSLYGNFLQTDAPINPGNSGGALVNLRGEVIGIPTRILNNTEGIGFAIPMRLAKLVMQKLIKFGKFDRGFLGTSVTAIDETLVRQLSGTDIATMAELLADLGLEKAEGAYVHAIEPGSPAAKAGLKVGDVIVAIDGTEVRLPDDLVYKVADTLPGTKVSVAFLRDGKRQEKEAVLTLRPAPVTDR